MLIKNSCLDCRFGFKTSKKQEKSCDWLKKNSLKIDLPPPVKRTYCYIERSQPYVNCKAHKK